jgi:hypothetical protein
MHAEDEAERFVLVFCGHRRWWLPGAQPATELMPTKSRVFVGINANNGIRSAMKKTGKVCPPPVYNFS